MAERPVHTILYAVLPSSSLYSMRPVHPDFKRVALDRDVSIRRCIVLKQHRQEF